VTFADVERGLLERGWAAVDLLDASPVHAARTWLLNELRKIFPGLAKMEDYHTLAADDDHTDVVYGVSERFWQAGHGRAIISANAAFFQQLLGPDLHVQQYPYLRVVRPGHTKEAVPLHRDTYYGASPFELSVVVPFTDMDATSALRAVPGSHIEPDTAYPFVQTVSDDVTIGSVRHKLGYAYAPRLLDAAIEPRTEPMPVRVGQALIFGLSLIHGGGVNLSNHTRFSTDIRVVNSLAPVNFSRGVHTDYYIPLCASPVSISARRYLSNNQPPIAVSPDPAA
jgi:hypothetical protein